MNRHYTYIYLDPRKPGKFAHKELVFDYQPFYVGKGADKRYKKSLLAAKSNQGKEYRHNKIRSILKIGLEPLIIIVYKEISEQEAFEREKELINTFKDYLTNRTNGGEGISGLTHSDETIKTLSNKSKELWKDPDYRERVLANRAKAIKEGRGKKKRNYTDQQLLQRANDAKRKRRAIRKNKI